MSINDIVLFVTDIENKIYNQELIYRSIIITNDNNTSLLIKTIMEDKDYSIKVVDEIENIDYNNIDVRILIMQHDKFKDFLNYMENHNGGVLNSSYNFISIYYTIPMDTVKKLINIYLQMTNNNINNTIIMDKYYSNMTNLNRIY